ncbi:MAG: transmembrane protein EpsH [Acidobacteria bacterium OLB17]|nr:MAG: transmembrane protein EpsH [Acidobacteria bacterium OLB17]MCZ2390048.1 exosortase [Acidobacteriota bacterium]
MSDEPKKGTSALAWLFVAAALAALYWAPLAKLGVDWWTDENYSHGLLIPFIIGVVLWANRRDLVSPQAVSRAYEKAGLGVVLAGILLFSLGVLGSELFTQRISFVIVAAGIVLYAGGSRLFRLAGIFFVLFTLAIPLPQILFNKIALPLQFTASKIAVWGIRLLDVPTVRKGNIIDILPAGATQTISLEVVEACSGIRSLMTLMAIALLLGFFTRSKEKLSEGVISGMTAPDLARTAVLMILSVPVAVATNAIRVSATGWLTYLYGIGASEGTVHEMSGFATYAGALLILLAVNIALQKAFFRRPHAE